MPILANQSEPCMMSEHSLSYWQDGGIELSPCDISHVTDLAPLPDSGKCMEWRTFHSPEKACELYFVSVVMILRPNVQWLNDFTRHRAAFYEKKRGVWARLVKTAQDMASVSQPNIIQILFHSKYKPINKVLLGIKQPVSLSSDIFNWSDVAFRTLLCSLYAVPCGIYAQCVTRRG